MNRKTLALLISLVVLISACRGAAQSAPPPPASFHPQIVSSTANVRVPSGKAATVSASCKPGEQMLGGGFWSSDLFESAASIISSYSSSASTWTVTGVGTASFFNANVEVYCLQSDLPLQVSIVHSTAPKVACPQKTVLLSEGVQSLSSDVYNPAGRTSYALCAASHVTSGQRPTTVFNPHSSLHSYNPSAGTVTCPTGQVAVGGEYQDDSILGSTAGSSFTGWSVLASGDTDLTITALCVIFTQ